MLDKPVLDPPSPRLSPEDGWCSHKCALCLTWSKAGSGNEQLHVPTNMNFSSLMGSCFLSQGQAEDHGGEKRTSLRGSGR
ncbi:hypothetical protein Y1Q_0013161 [Alligator mississippiensis]|uniref:Uncharacterized protein n=1 Tax=Alligator mississippiensis TaxID=8496 RepID=A0A151NH60_ALLMI|nr:hypothetical protein Y1Q_0013161 [Alligator mississippiensis]